jgi:hypothetical protein
LVRIFFFFFQFVGNRPIEYDTTFWNKVSFIVEKPPTDDPKIITSKETVRQFFGVILVD